MPRFFGKFVFGRPQYRIADVVAAVRNKIRLSSDKKSHRPNKAGGVRNIFLYVLFNSSFDGNGEVRKRLVKWFS